MKFGPLALTKANGAALAHSLTVEEDGKRRKLPKGAVLTAADIAALTAQGLTEIWAARLDAGDLGEDDAAATLANAAAGTHVRAGVAFTGRANLLAECAGLVVVDRILVDTLNGIDESLTLATLQPFEAVRAGQMLATIKIIPLGAPVHAVKKGVAELAACAPVRVEPFMAKRVGLLSTQVPGMKQSVLDKTRRTLDKRLDLSGSVVVSEKRVAHTIAAVAHGIDELLADGADLLVAFSASAVVDRGDIVPAGLVAAGGNIQHFGLPVDPGNLLVLGAKGDIPFIGAPGCARTPKLNGFDWVLNRVIAGLTPDARDIAAMGVGGLLKEIASRPQPRSGRK